MRLPRQGWQLLLFVAAILVPSAALVVMTSRIVQQGKELVEKRRQDERRAALDRIARDLQARLESIERQAAGDPERPGPPVTLVAPVRDGHLVLPWENDAAVRRIREQLSEPRFRETMARAERDEFAGRRPEAAEAAYREALRGAGSPGQAAQARLLLARLLEKRGRSAEAADQFGILLDTPAGLVDEDGIPFRLHAATYLVSPETGRSKAVAAVRAALDSRKWLSPMACFSASELASRLKTLPGDPRPAEELSAAVQSRIHGVEQAEALQNEAARLGLLQSKPGSPRTWLLHGDPPWLVTLSPGSSPLVIAVSAAEILKPLESRTGARFLLARQTAGEPVGDAFPGLRAAFPPPDGGDARESQQHRIYLTAVVLLAGANIFAAYLLWRSLRREMQLAETRSQFVSSVSHELKTPLTAIRMYAETLQMGRSRDPATMDEYLETIANECGRLSRLVDNVLLFSKIEQGRKVYRFRPLALAEAAGAAARTLAYPLAQSGFELRTNLDEDVPPVNADRDAIEQAVLNLLTNAMKYSGESRVIDLRVLRRDGEAVIEVSDQGVGMAVEEKARIFEKYYRIPTRENQAIPGTGLGLALVSQIVKAHGGRVDVESEPGKGSTFSLRLPIPAESKS